MNILQSGICSILLSAGTETSSIGTFVNEHLNSDFVMGAVFAGLIFICILIYLFKFSSLANRDIQNESTSFAADQGSSQTTVINEEVLTADSELVAVITAAIMASMGNEAPADGLFIRSIRKSNGNRWKNA